MHRPKPRVSDATQEIHANTVAKPSGSRASLPKKPAATNTTKMSSTLDHMPVPPQAATLTLLAALPYAQQP